MHTRFAALIPIAAAALTACSHNDTATVAAPTTTATKTSQTTTPTTTTTPPAPTTTAAPVTTTPNATPASGHYTADELAKTCAWLRDWQKQMTDAGKPAPSLADAAEYALGWISASPTPPSAEDVAKQRDAFNQAVATGC